MSITHLYTRIRVCRLLPIYCDISRLGERVQYMARQLIGDIPTKECDLYWPVKCLVHLYYSWRLLMAWQNMICICIFVFVYLCICVFVYLCIVYLCYSRVLQEVALEDAWDNLSPLSRYDLYARLPFPAILHTLTLSHIPLYISTRSLGVFHGFGTQAVWPKPSDRQVH